LSTFNVLSQRKKEMNRAELEASAASLARVLEAAPDFANGWFTLGEMRRQLGDTEAAIAAFRRVIDLDRSDIFGAGLRLVRLGATMPDGMPEAYVRGMFDQYAPRFDSELVETLGYRAPALLRAAVEAACRTQGCAAFDAMLDLGCGTGLSGAAFRDCVKHLTGVDLSSGMIALAQQKNIYDRLEADDIERFLAGEIGAVRTYSLIVAADVFTYLGSLTGVCAAVARVMSDGALFALTVETYPGDGVALGEGLRYAHGAAHVRSALAGLEILQLTEVSTRNEAGMPVPGLLVVAQRNKPRPRPKTRSRKAG
jgi:predicted TPR repeat methyltransferase